LSALLEHGSRDEAAGRAEHLSSAAAKVAKRCGTEELEVLQAFVDVLKGRLRRKWKQQRRNNAGAALTATVLGTVVTLITRSASPAPAWMTVSLVALAALVGLIGVWSLADATDWKRDEAARRCHGGLVEGARGPGRPADLLPRPGGLDGGAGRSYDRPRSRPRRGR